MFFKIGQTDTKNHASINIICHASIKLAHTKQSALLHRTISEDVAGLQRFDSFHEGIDEVSDDERRMNSDWKKMYTTVDGCDPQSLSLITLRQVKMI